MNMHSERIDIFYCRKCGRWFNDIIVFEEHCSHENCIAQIKTEISWDSDDGDNAEIVQKEEQKEEPPESGIVLYLYPIGQGETPDETHGSTSSDIKQLNTPSICDRNFEITKYEYSGAGRNNDSSFEVTKFEYTNSGTNNENNFEVTKFGYANVGTNTNNNVDDELVEEIHMCTLICGRCYNIFHEIDKFKEHRSSEACSCETPNNSN